MHFFCHSSAIPVEAQTKPELENIYSMLVIRLDLNLDEGIYHLSFLALITSDDMSGCDTDRTSSGKVSLEGYREGNISNVVTLQPMAYTS
jgi:hypothetical protein